MAELHSKTARMGVAILATGFFVWYVCSNRMSAPLYQLASPETWWLSRSAGTLIALPLCLVMCRVFVSESRRRRVDWIAAAAQTGCMLVIVLHDVEPLPALAFVAIFEFGSLWLMLRWSERYVMTDPRRLALSVIVAYALIAVEKSISVLVPEVAIAGALSLLPMLSAAMLVFHRDEASAPNSGEEPVYTRSTLPSLWRVAMAIAVFFFIWSLINALLKVQTGYFSFGDQANPTLVILAQALLLSFSVFSYWWLFVARHRLDVATIWRLAFVIIALSFSLLLCFGYVQPLQMVTNTAVVIAKLFLWFTLVNIARRSDVSCRAIILGGMLLFTVPDFLARVFVYGLGLGANGQAFAGVSFFAITVALAFFTPRRSPDAESLLSDLETPLPRVSETYEPRGADEACADISRRFSLSSREEDVLGLLCAGRSRPYIAETLFISENTVRTHVKRIYAKLGVHSRQDLLDLFGEYLRNASDAEDGRFAESRPSGEFR